jgi:hypothetical protein
MAGKPVNEHQIQLATSAKQTFKVNKAAVMFKKTVIQLAVHELADIISNLTGSEHLILCTVFEMKEVW